MASVTQLAREVKLIRSGLPLDELVKRSKLIDKLEGQLNGYKSEIKDFKRVTKDTASKADKAVKETNAYKKEFNKFKDQVAKDSKKLLGEIDKKTKPLQDAYKKLDGGLQRMTKGLDRWVSVVGAAFSVAGVAISFMALFASAGNQRAFDRQVDRFQIDMTKQWSVMQQLKSRIDNLRNETNRRIQRLEREADLVSSAVKTARSFADRAYKLANDGLYESRVRIQRLGSDVAVARTQAQQATTKNAQQDITINALKSQAFRAEQEAQQARVGVRLVDSKATIAQSTAKTAQAEATQARVGVRLVDSKATIAQSTATQATVAASVANAKAISLQPQITQAITTANQALSVAKGIRIPPPITQLTNTNQGSTATQQTLSQSQFNQLLRQSGIILKADTAQLTANTALTTANAAVQIANGASSEPIGRSALGLAANQQARLNSLDSQIQQLKTNPPNLLDPRVPDLQRRIGEREAVDQQALQKINEIQKQNSLLVPAILAGLTPAMQSIVGFSGNQIRGDISKLPEATATAVQAAPCNGRGCGGSTARRVNELGDDLAGLRNQVNSLPNNVGNAINGANAVANAAQLSLLNTINGKLGSLLPNGGIGGILSRIAKSSAVDKALQVMTFVGVMHNAFNLSADLGRSFFSLSSSAINATLRTMGITTADDTPIDVGAIISGQIEAQIKALIGVESWTQMNRALASANRIYQSGSNVISNVWSMADSTRNVLEYTAENTGRIGNALKKERLVSPNAYPDMPERVTARTGIQRKWDNIIEGVESLQTGVSALDSTFQSVVSINDSIADYQRSTKEFKDSIKESPIPEVAANLAVKAKREAASAASAASPTVADVPVDAAEEPDAVTA